MVIVNVYTNGTVIVNTFTVKGAISPIIVNVYTNGSVYTNECYKARYKKNFKVLSAENENSEI